jgi:hypothetical protein
VVRKPNEEPKPETARVCIISRDEVRIDDLRAQITLAGFSAEREHLGADAWQLEPRAVVGLLEKIRAIGIPLTVYAGAKPYRGILTGFNDAFPIDSASRNSIIELSKNFIYIVKIYISSQDIKFNSPLMWWHNWRFLPHMKDEALSPMAFLMETLPIAQPSDAVRSEIEASATRLIEIAKSQQNEQRDLLDWLQVEYEITAPSLRLQSPTELDSDGFVAEVQKLRGKKKPLSVAALRALREEYARSIAPACARAAEARALETRVSDLVNAAYGLTPDEIRLMWDTAPPRMPIPRPAP